MNGLPIFPPKYLSSKEDNSMNFIIGKKILFLATAVLSILLLSMSCASSGAGDATVTDGGTGTGSGTGTDVGTETDGTGTGESLPPPDIKGLWVVEFSPAVQYDESSNLTDRVLIEIDATNFNLYFFNKTNQVGGQKCTYTQTTAAITLTTIKNWDPTNFWVDATAQRTFTYLYAETYMDLQLPIGTNARTYKKPPFGFDNDLIHEWEYDPNIQGSLRPKYQRAYEIQFIVGAGETHPYTWHEYTGQSQDVYSQGTLKTCGEYILMQWEHTGENYDIPVDKLSFRKYSKSGSGSTMLLTVDGENGTYVLKISQ